MKFAVLTLGCRVNQADSFRIEHALLSAGGERVPAAAADAVVVNTCSVTAAADQGARQLIRRIARDNPGVRIVTTGCYSTRSPEELAGLPGVAAVVPNGDKTRVPAAAREALGDVVVAERFGGNGPCGRYEEPGGNGRTAFLLRVQTGCEERCSYCIIPRTRGPGRSLEIAAVLRDVKRAVDAGFKEIVLTGVHLGSYGRDLRPAASLSDLLGALCDFSGDVLFRLSSLEPMDCTPDVVDLVCRSPVFAPSFHLPLQHASDRLLRAMRRPYTLADYEQLVNRIREQLPHASIGADVMIGFPGEEDDDHDILCRYLDASPLTTMHVFPYSDRPGTAASTFGARPSGAIVRRRAAEVREIGRRLADRFRVTQRGSIRRGLSIDDGSTVRTDNGLTARLRVARPRNSWVTVRLEGAAKDGELFAEALS